MSTAVALSNAYAEQFPGEVAELLGLRDPETLARDIADIGVAGLLAVFDRMRPAPGREALLALDPAVREDVLRRAQPRVAAMILTWLKEDECAAVLNALPADLNQALTGLLNYPAGSAGRLMERVLDTVQPGMSVHDVLERLRASELTSRRTLYVTDRDNRLHARVDMQDLALADRADPIDAYIRPLEAVATVTDPRDTVVRLLESGRTDSIPVVDAEGRLLGVVRYSTLFAAIEDAARVDIQKMVGASADERALSGVWFSVRRRLPWLHINLLTAFLAAAVVALFEGLIAQFTALAVLLPVVAGQSGNAGCQALAVTLRGLALHEIGVRDWKRVLDKESRVGIVNGLALAVTCGGGVWLWSASFWLGVVIAVAMVLAMVAAGAAGALTPLMLTRFGQDPATASSIILTTVTDVAGFFAFLGTATLLAALL